MRHPWQVVIVVMLLFTFVCERAVVPTRASESTEPAMLDLPTVAGTAGTPADLPPLPRGCIGGGTGQRATAPSALCCISGYVVLDGKAVADAEVMLKIGTKEYHTWTNEGPDSKQPYFFASLSDPPLDATAGTTITITVRYDHFEQTVQHTLLSGGQRVDVTLAPAKAGSFVYDGQVFQTPDAINPHLFQRYRQDDDAEFDMYKPDVAVDTRGMAYVTDWNNGRIQVFNKSWQYVRQWGTKGNRAQQFNGPSGIAIDKKGNVYVVEMGNHRVQKFSTNGTFVKMWGSFQEQPVGSSTPVPTDKLAYPAGIAVDNDSNGDVYVADTGNHRVIRYSSDGVPLTTWQFGSEQYPYSIAIGSNNTIYVAIAGTNTVAKFARPAQDNQPTVIQPSITTTPFKFGDTRASDEKVFALSAGIAVDTMNNVYVSDSGNNRIVVLDANGTFKYASKPTGSYALNYAGGIEVTSMGILYVANANEHRVRLFSVGNTSLVPYKSLGRPGGMDERLTTTGGIAITTTATLTRTLIADTGSHRVLLLENGALKHVWGDNGENNYTTSITDTTRFNRPTGLVIWNNAVLVVDSGLKRVLRLSLDNLDAPPTVLIDGTSADGKTITDPNEQFEFRNSDTDTNFTGGIAVDAAGNLYVANTLKHRIARFRLEANNTARYVRSYFVGDTSTPTGVAVLKDGTVLIVDPTAKELQSIPPATLQLSTPGVLITTVWRTELTIPSFDQPIGIAVDADDRVYVTSSENNRVFVFDSNRQWLETIGKHSAIGPGDMIEPQAIAVTGSGTQRVLYVADHDGGGVQYFRPSQNIKPNATIVTVRKNDDTTDEIKAGDTVKLRGIGAITNPATTIARFEWTIQPTMVTPTVQPQTITTANQTLNGATAYPAVSTSELRVSASGEYTVTLRVQDTAGNWSNPQTTALKVSPAPGASVTWTFLLYLAGDNTDIKPFLDETTGVLARLGRSRANTNVNIVALYDGNGPSDTTLYVMKGGLSSFTIKSPDEKNMGDPQTLIDFVREGKKQAPADYYYLAIADHANGLDGIAWDKTSGEDERLTNAELHQALNAITGNGTQPIDVLHFDGCLMGQLENAYQMSGMAHYLVTSQNLGWSAFAYDAYRDSVTATTTPYQLARSIVDIYGIRVQGNPYTIAAFDMKQLDGVMRAFDRFSQALYAATLDGKFSTTQTLALRKQVQKFDSDQNYALNNADAFIDLKDWVNLVHNAPNVNVSSSVYTTTEQLSKTLALLTQPINGEMGLIENHASGTYEGKRIDLSHAHGLSIYFPDRMSKKTNVQYIKGDLAAFSEATSWDEYLSATFAEATFDTSEPEAVANSPLPLTIETSFPLSNLVRNSGFEQETNPSSNSPAEWSLQGATRVTYPQQTTGHALQFAPGPGASSTATQTITRVQSLESYSLSATVFRMESMPNVSIVVQWQNASGSLLGTTTALSFNDATAAGTRKSLQVVAPSTAAKAVLRIEVPSGGFRVLVDDLSLRAANMLSNSDFEVARADRTPNGWNANARAQIVQRSDKPGTNMLDITAADDSSFTISQSLVNVTPASYEFACALRIVPLSATPSITLTTARPSPNPFLFQIDVEWFGAQQQPLGVSVLTTTTQYVPQWTTAKVTLLAPGGTVSGAVHLSAASLNATINVDDCSLRTSSLAVNTSFRLAAYGGESNGRATHRRGTNSTTVRGASASHTVGVVSALPHVRTYRTALGKWSRRQADVATVERRIRLRG